MSIETLTVEALAGKLDYIERIDRLTTIAEGRRNASLREIDRRRTALGETLRRSVQDVEDGELEVIETTPEGKICDLTSDRKIQANRRRNALGVSTSVQRRARGRARAAHNARRHGLSLSVFADPALSEQTEAVAREIAGEPTNDDIYQLARRVAEAQIDLQRVRDTRHQLLCDALADPYYESEQRRERN